MGFLPECKLKQDFDAIRQKIQNVYDNQGNIEYQSYEEIFTAKKNDGRNQSFYFTKKEIDWHNNYFYYGTTTTMRDVQQDPFVEIAGIETTMPVERISLIE